MDKITVLLWGAGRDCEDNMALLPDSWIKKAIVDSNCDKIGKRICGVPIIGTDRLDEYEYDYIIITSSKYANEILQDIESLGVSPMKVLNGNRSKLQASKEEHLKYYQGIIDKRNRQYDSEYRFECRRQNSSKLFYVLAGYKPLLWRDVFDRMKRFIPKDIDVCLLSSGLYNEELSSIAEKNDWSYLSTSVNDVAIIQNLVISLFPKAQFIFKMDEDVYITKKCCQKMLDVYRDAAKETYKIGFVGPMIPLHTNGHFFVKKFHLEQKYEELTGYKYLQGGRWTNPGFASDPRIPIFLWSQGNLDDLNRKVENDLIKYVATPIKYAICFILFHRSVYEEMGGFNVVPETRSAGINGDEGQIIEFCMNHCKCMVVAVNTLCGHFSYPWQEKDVIEFRKKNYDYFKIKD